MIIPCYQEELALPGLATALEAWSDLPGLELILVDDGSLDRTGEEARRLFPRARILRHPENRGIGAALCTGTMAAGGDLIAWYDADCSYAPEVLPALAAALDGSDADAVTASPWHPRGGIEGVGPARALPSRLVSRLYRLLAPGRLHTYTAMVRLHRRDAILRALPLRPGFPGVTESLLRILVAGGRVIELPATLRTRRTGASKLRFFRVLLGHLGLMGALVTGRLKTPNAPQGA